MGVCNCCGKSGFFVFVNDTGLCSKCAKISMATTTATFKKQKSSSYNVDFVSVLTQSIDHAVVSFDDTLLGYISVNGTPQPICSDYIDAVGYSSDGKYQKIRTNTLAFWVTPNDFPSFLTMLKQVRADYMEKLRSQCQFQITFPVYLQSDRDFFDLNTRFNVEGVSHTYEEPATDIVKHLSVGDTVNLELGSISPTPEETKIIIMTDSKRRQFGWTPSFDSYTHNEITNQLLAGVRLTATVAGVGKVQNSEADIWWCEVDFTLKMPYSQADECVYITETGRKYHASASCFKNATWKVPLSFAHYRNMEPCSKCCLTNDKK